MARYDKYEPLAGGFRAALADDWVADDGEIVGVGLDVDGHVVPGASNSGVCGVVILVGADSKKAGRVVDVMTDGEILEVDVDGLGAGTAVFVTDGDGTLADSGDTLIGFTVEADRLVVRAAQTGTGS